MGKSVVAWALLLLAAQAPAVASGASSGEITRAHVTPDWAMASVAGVAVRSSGCIFPPEEPPAPEKELPPPILPDSPPWTCGWIPYLTAGPGSSPSDCLTSSRRLDSLGPGVQLVWVGPEQKQAGSAAFDYAGIGLEQGSAAPLLCLAAVEAVEEGVVCPAEEGFPCPPYAIVHRTHQLDWAFFEIFTHPSAPVVLGESISPPASPKPCSTRKGNHAKRKARIGIGPSVQVSGKPQRVRRCKRG